jgi:type IV secretion system protein VirD4
VPATKFLFLQTVIVLALVTLGLWSATEWVARQLSFQPRLGTPWFLVAGFPLYYPWRLFQWWYAYEAYQPKIFSTGGWIAAGGSLITALAAIIGSIWRARQSRLATTYGSARWASSRGISRAGLRQRASFFRKSRWPVPSAQRPGAHHGLCADPLGEGRGPCHPDASHLARIRRPVTRS